MPRPNVLFLMSDQHNAKCLGAAGHEVVQTPNLDRLAQRGVRLTSAYTQNPICTPSRMCYLTGQYCHNHGYYGLSGPRPAQLPSLFEQFHGAGYHTGAIGKVHLPDGWIEPHTDFFCESFGKAPEGLPNYKAWLAERSDIAPHNEQHFDGRPDPLGKELDYDSGYALEMTREFVARGGEQPFMLWLTLYKPHQEYSPAGEFWDMYPDPPMPPNLDSDAEQKLPPMRRMMNAHRNNPKAQYEPGDVDSLRTRKLRGYYGNITQVDWTVGQVLDHLADEGLLENTIVVYCSDHGDFACEHGILEKAPGISSDAIGRIPMIWSWPGHLPEGETRDELVETLDVWPTLARFCDLPRLAMWDGHDIGDLLAGFGGPVRDAAFTEHPWSKTVTTERWRMTWTPGSMWPDDPVQGELYDRAADPWEMNNLYGDPAHAGVVAELTARLMDWLVTTRHPVTAWPVAPHPDIDDGRRALHRGEPLPEDGRTSPAQIRDAVGRGRANYL